METEYLSATEIARLLPTESELMGQGRQSPAFERAILNPG